MAAKSKLMAPKEAKQSKRSYHGNLSADVEDVPQIDDNSSTDHQGRKETVYLAADGQAEGSTGCQHPRPPRQGKFAARSSSLAYGGLLSRESTDL